MFATPEGAGRGGGFMTRRSVFFASAFCALVFAFVGNISFGAERFSVQALVSALFAFDDANYDHFIIVFQRLPRALIAVYAGMMMACAGAVLQGLLRNPLASPSLLGINAGATLFVVTGVVLFQLPPSWHGVLAVAGAAFGLMSCFAVTRMVGLANDTRGLGLILSGALVSMFYIGLANAILLTDPLIRSALLSWVSGNINHVYSERLQDFWLLGVLGLAGLLVLAKPLTLVMIGADKAASAGVAVTRISRLAMVAVLCAAGSAVAICGPIGFVGLVVPHIVRPFTGAALARLLPGCMVVGAAICLLADLIARLAFAPYIVHTGVIMDLLGGIVFILIVRHFYVRAGRLGRS